MNGQFVEETRRCVENSNRLQLFSPEIKELQENLKECPYCNGRALLDRREEFPEVPGTELYFWVVVCGECFISTPRWDTPYGAAKHWDCRGDESCRL
jgi:uncharacterized protein with PIN domain